MSFRWSAKIACLLLTAPVGTELAQSTDKSSNASIDHLPALQNLARSLDNLLSHLIILMKLYNNEKENPSSPLIQPTLVAQRTHRCSWPRTRLDPAAHRLPCPLSPASGAWRSAPRFPPARACPPSVCLVTGNCATGRGVQLSPCRQRFPLGLMTSTWTNLALLAIEVRLQPNNRTPPSGKSVGGAGGREVFLRPPKVCGAGAGQLRPYFCREALGTQAKHSAHEGAILPPFVAAATSWQRTRQLHEQDTDTLALLCVWIM